MDSRSRRSASPNGPKVRHFAPHANLIQLAPDALAWEIGKHPKESYRELTPEPEAFSKFLELADAPPERILAFAKRNGVLGLCKHGLPMCHDPRLPDAGEPASPPYWPPLYCKRHFTQYGIMEPLDSWRSLARAARAVLTLKHSMPESRATQRTQAEWESNWKAALWLSAQQYARGGHWDCESEYQLCQLPQRIRRPFGLFGQNELANVVDEWLACGGIRLRAYWSRDRNQSRLELVVDARHGPNLFGFLALQLAQRWDVGEGLTRCPCGQFFSPSPTTSPRRRNFCRACRGAGKPGTFHMATYRHRIRDARRMKAEGDTIAQIAKKLSREPAQIRGWVM
jgi:hypothetical protein